MQNNSFFAYTFRRAYPARDISLSLVLITAVLVLLYWVDFLAAHAAVDLVDVPRGEKAGPEQPRGRTWIVMIVGRSSAAAPSLLRLLLLLLAACTAKIVVYDTKATRDAFGHKLWASSEHWQVVGKYTSTIGIHEAIQDRWRAAHRRHTAPRFHPPAGSSKATSTAAAVLACGSELVSSETESAVSVGEVTPAELKVFSTLFAAFLAWWCGGPGLQVQ